MHAVFAREDRRLLKSLGTSLDFYTVLFGLALCRVWIILCLSAPFTLTQPESGDWLFLIPGGIGTLVAALAAARAAERTTFVRGFKAITGILVGACVACAPVVEFTGQRWLLVAFLVMSGVGSSCLQVLWGAAFARRELTFSLYCYPASAVITAVLVALVMAGGELVAFGVFPLASFLLLLVTDETGRAPWTAENAERDGAARGDASAVAGEEADGGADARMRDEEPLPSHTIVRLLVSIAVFSFLCRFFDGLPTGDVADPLALVGGSSLFALVATGVGFLVFVLLAGRTFNPLLGYRVALPLMAAGMAIIALFFSHHWYLSILLIGMGYELFDTLAWTLLVMLAQNQRVRLSPYAIFGWGTAATMLGMGVGRLTGALVANGLAAGTVELSAVGVVCVMALVVTAFLVIPEGTFAQIAGMRFFDRNRNEPRHSDMEHGASAVSSASCSSGTSRNPLEAACEMVAGEYRLTPRESEVLLLLARGRTLAIVVRDLGIAKGTAQTHMENVYQKLGVHKQQELIDLVESYLEE